MSEPNDRVHQRVVAFLAEGVGREPEWISLNESLANFEIDSLEIVELTMKHEDESGRQLPDFPHSNLLTVGDLVSRFRKLSD